MAVETGEKVIRFEEHDGWQMGPMDDSDFRGLRPPEGVPSSYVDVPFAGIGPWHVRQIWQMTTHLIDMDYTP